MSEFMKVPCKNCPFRWDVKPFLTPEFGEELAYSATNPYNSFPCHLTTEDAEDDDGTCDRIAVESSKECAGFLSLMSFENGGTCYDDNGFEPSLLAYDSVYDMVEAYTGERE